MAQSDSTTTTDSPGLNDTDTTPAPTATTTPDPLNLDRPTNSMMVKHICCNYAPNSPRAGLWSAGVEVGVCAGVEVGRSDPVWVDHCG